MESEKITSLDSNDDNGSLQEMVDNQKKVTV